MEKVVFRRAAEEDIPFIAEVYRQNIESLHGAERSEETWRKLLEEQTSVYYVAETGEPAAWFRMEREGNTLWLGMLQVSPAFQRRGLGRRILSFFEKSAEESGCACAGIHTTEDNIPARALYQACGYTVREIGPCTTADGVERTGYTYMKEI